MHCIFCQKTEKKKNQERFSSKIRHGCLGDLPNCRVLGSSPRDGNWAGLDALVAGGTRLPSCGRLWQQLCSGMPLWRPLVATPPPAQSLLPLTQWGVATNFKRDRRKMFCSNPLLPLPETSLDAPVRAVCPFTSVTVTQYTLISR